MDVGATFGKTGNATISMRGMPTDYTLILIDGRRQNVAGNITPNGFGDAYTAFIPPPAAIERIEVIRGPMSTLYGSDAMGGVVNIITRKVSDTWGGSITADYTLAEDDDYGSRYGSNIYTSGPLIPGKLGLTLRGSYIHREASSLYFTDDTGVRRQVYGDPAVNFNTTDAQGTRGFNPSEGDIWTLGARLDFVAGPNHNFYFDADWARQAYDNSNGELGNVDNPTTGNYSGYKDELRFNRDQYALAWTGRFDLGTLDASLMYNSTETLGRTLANAVVPAGGLLGRNRGDDRTLTNDNFVFDAKFVAPVGDRHTLTIGTQYWDAEMEDGIAFDTTTGGDVTFEGSQWSLFAEDEWRIVDDVALTLGLRYDNHDTAGDHVSPRGYVVWNTTPEWTIKAGVSQGFKTPAINSIHDGIIGVGGQGTTLSYGNPDLEPETSTSYEFGFIYDNRSDFSAGATVFFTEFKDKIGSVTLPGGASQTANIDEAESYGIETFASYTFLENWTLTANYTWTKSEQKSGSYQGDPLYSTPEHVANLRLRWRATGTLSLWVAGEYRGESHRGYSTATNAGGTASRTARDIFGDYKAYQLYHLGATWKATDRLTFNASIRNLLDKDFVDFRSYVSGGTTYYTNMYDNLIERRHLWVSATFTF